jgi:dTDP-4-dehydrorhamnose reductase
MNTLVTGSGGLVGSALVRTGEVTGLTRDQLDITDEAAVARALSQHRPASLINAAAQAGVDRADLEPEWTHKVNGAAPGLLARLAADQGVRFVHLSTDYVLDAPELERMPETVEPRPCSTYARSKLEGEQAVLRAGGTVVRLQWVYSPLGRGFFNHALTTMKAGDSVRLVTDQVGCPTPAELLAPALLKIAGAEATGLFHLATQGAATAHEWIAAGAEAAGIPLRAQAALRADFEGAHRPSRSVLDSSKVAEIFGIRLPDWRDALQTVMASGDRLGDGATP